MLKILVVGESDDQTFDDSTLAIVQRLADGWHIFTPDGEEHALGNELSDEEAREATISYLAESALWHFEDSADGEQ